ncbi:MAG: flavin reductase [Dyadobacter sp. 50-39]|uniref:flavin reductase family protein n=1 Tax=Dyadobacter sp. 50-39 TaxID=1895756 RepID=UPI00095F5008|nr:flavin reductase [Dyadobacter sp. 50-39]OJV12681.1 MAG: flavin reductase [Dyadobacter sp. 50-39]
MYHVNEAKILEMEKFYRINLINSLIGYKSLNLLGTVRSDGVSNLCVVSSVFHLGASPALVGLIMRPERAHNDTLKNIKSSTYYTLNNVISTFYKQAHQTSASYPSGVSEFTECGLQEFYIKDFSAPFVLESTVRIGLELQQLIPLTINGTTMVIGKVVEIMTADEILEEDGNLSHTQAGSMTVTGLDSYFIPEFVGRLPYAKP